MILGDKHHQQSMALVHLLKSKPIRTDKQASTTTNLSSNQLGDPNVWRESTCEPNLRMSGLRQILATINTNAVTTIKHEWRYQGYITIVTWNQKFADCLIAQRVDWDTLILACMYQYLSMIPPPHAASRSLDCNLGPQLSLLPC